MGKIKNLIKFLYSLPGFSRPGIIEDDVFDFLKQYSSDVPPAVIKLSSRHFINSLPDSNMFSQMDIMVLINTLKNNFDFKDYVSVYSGLCSVISKYDRSILSFNDLISSVKNTEESSLEKGVKEIKGVLSNVSKNSELLKYHKKYNNILNKAVNEKNNNNVKSAMLSLEEAVLLNPARSEAYFGLSNLYDFDNNSTDAVGVISDLIAKSNCEEILSNAYLRRAELSFYGGNYESALQDLKQVVDYDYKKYVWQSNCRNALKNNSLFKRTKQSFNKLLFCMIKPGLRYYKSTKKKKGVYDDVSDLLYEARTSNNHNANKAIDFMNTALKKDISPKDKVKAFLLRANFRYKKQNAYGAICDCKQAKKWAAADDFSEIRENAHKFFDSSNMTIREILKAAVKTLFI